MSDDPMEVTVQDLIPPTTTSQANDRFYLYFNGQRATHQNDGSPITRIHFNKWLELHGIEVDSGQALQIEAGIAVNTPEGVVRWQRIVD